MGYKRASDAYYVPQFTLENRAKKARSILCRGCSLQDNFFMDVQGEEHCGERIIIPSYGGFVFGFARNTLYGFLEHFRYEILKKEQPLRLMAPSWKSFCSNRIIRTFT